MSKSITLSQEQESRLMVLFNNRKVKDMTITEYIARTFDLGLSTREQRTASYEKQKDNAKLGRQLVKQVKADAELAKEFGLAVKDGQLVRPVNIQRS